MRIRSKAALVTGAALAVASAAAWYAVTEHRLRSRVFRMGYAESQTTQFVAARGGPTGPAVEVLKEAARRRGIQLQWIHRPEGPEAALRSGAVDLWPILGDFPQRRAFAHITAPWRTLRYWTVARRQPLTRTALVALPPGSPEVLARQLLPAKKPLLVRTTTAVLAAVCTGEADLALIPENGTLPVDIIRSPVCEGVDLVMQPIPGAVVPFGTAATLKNPEAPAAADAIREAIRTLALDGTLADIHLRWSTSFTNELLVIREYESSRRQVYLLSAGLFAVLLTLGVILRQNARVRQARRQAEKARGEAERAAAARSEFLANMSHEIRTPMNGVLGTSELLASTRLDREQQELAEIISDSARALLAILNDILDSAKLSAGKLALERAPMDLEEVVESVVSLLGHAARQRGVDLLMRVEPALHRPLTGDAVRIRQVLLNLAGNAIKFTEAGHVLIAARLRSSQGNQCTVRIEVEDTGIGIPESARDRLFQKFSQLDASTTRVYGGTGLGLSICRQLVELMGGEIGVEARAGGGSRFWFQIPLEARDGAANAAPAAPEGRLLVISASEVVRQVLVEQLAGVAASVETAESVAEAKLLPGLPPVVVADGPQAEGALTELPNARLVLLGDAIPAGDLPSRAVWLRKPATPGRLQAAIAGLRAPAQAMPPHCPQPGQPFAGLRVLLAEDNPVNQKLTVRMLERLGCTTDVAPNGRVAIAKAEAGAYDIILMDCQMPEVDGIEASRRLRSGQVRHQPPIVALTAAAMPEQREQCLLAGMNDFLAKPVSLQQLNEVLSRWARRAEEAAAPLPKKEPTR